MDVRLPNGTIVKNVPDGTSKADLLAKLGSAGIDHGAAPTVPNAFTDANTSKSAAPPQEPSVAGGVARSLADIPVEAAKESQRAQKTLVGDFTRPVKPGIMPKVLRAGKTVADTAGYLLAPEKGALASVLTPVEKVTGMPREQIAGGVMASIPIGMGTKTQAAKDGAKAVEKLLSPTTVSPSARQAERTIRRATGEGSLEAEKAAAQLIEHNKVVGNLPVAEQRAMIDYIETRSKGAKIANPALQKSADAIAKVYDRYKARIGYILGPQNTPTFITDYYSHLWKDPPGKVTDSLNAFYAKQGSSRSLKQRTIPTISDGIKAGLTPRQENPIEATMTYAQNMSRYLATHDIQNEMKGLGHFKFYAPGNAPAGWVEINGINTTRNPVIQGAPKTSMPQPGPGAVRVVEDQSLLSGGQKDAIAKNKNLRVFSLLQNGKAAGRITGEIKGDTFWTSAIVGGDGKNTLGASNIRGLVGQLRAALPPSVKYISGERTTGARASTAAKGQSVKIPLGDSPRYSAGAPQAFPMKLYAPEGAARVYNNFISKGFEQGDVGPFYRAARAGANGLTMLKLGLSAFHASTMSNEGIIGETARAIAAASRGEVKTAAKAMGRAVTAPVSVPLRGKRMAEELVGKRVPSAADAKLNDLYVKSGGRLRMDPFYRTRASGSFYNSMERGTFAREAGEAVRKLYTGTLAEKAKAHVDLVGNVIQSVSAPLFEKYIPAMKRGAFASRMEDFMKSNPNATEKELNQYAIKLNDSIDNRFGELNQDNLFWKKQMKQLAQITLLSFSWDLGTVREIGGGIADAIPSAKGVIEGKGITDRTAYVAALAAVTALENGIATYLKTGTEPKGRDFMAYRTGGTDPTSGQPERAVTPGYQKDVYAFGYNFPHNILTETANKLNPALTAATGLATNKDYRGLPIVRPQGAAPQPGEPGIADYIMDTLMPISIGQFSKGEKRGSNLSAGERAMSIRPAPGYITAPDRQEALRNKYDTLEWRKRLRADKRQQSRQQP